MMESGILNRTLALGVITVKQAKKHVRRPKKTTILLHIYVMPF